MTMNNNMLSMLAQLKSNPMQMLSQRFRLPANMPNNPQEIIQHLLNTGQVTQSQVDNAMQMRKQFFGN